MWCRSQGRVAIILWPVRDLVDKSPPLHPFKVTKDYKGESVPFGSSDRAQLQQITKHLGDLAADLAAIKQQVNDQQHMIDQARRDATNAITSGLAEIRAVAREALARTSDTATGHLANIGSLDHVHHTAESPVTRAIAAHIHGKITTAVQAIIDRPHRGDGDGTPVRIVIDDRAAAGETTEQ